MADAPSEAPVESVHSAGVAAHISHAVIATYAAAAAREVEGVADLVGGALGALDRRVAPERLGVRVSGADGDIDVELHLVTEWGAPIPQVAAAVERAVRSYLEAMVALRVRSVGIHVDDVAPA